MKFGRLEWRLSGALLPTLASVALLCALGCGGSQKASVVASPTPQATKELAAAGSVFGGKNDLEVLRSASPSSVAASPGTSSSPGRASAGAGVASASPQAPKADSTQTIESTTIKAPGDQPWTLDTQRIVYSQGSERARVGRLTWTLHDKEGNKRLVVRADGADLNVKTKGISFDGPVSAEGPDGEKITVRRLVWDNGKRRLLGSHGVKIVRSDSILTGDNLVASPDLKKVTVEGNVQVEFPDGLSVNDDNAEWEQY